MLVVEDHAHGSFPDLWGTSSSDPRAKDYLKRKWAEGKSWSEAMRRLKRQLTNIVYRKMFADPNEGHLATWELI